VGFNLSAGNKRAIWIPPGFAHGFLALSQVVELLYKTTDYWAPEHERCIIWNDHDLAINWPLQGDPILSAKDKMGQKIKNSEFYP
jgi:dTDP-4-dehydrorhamnose 3,5-epimerase